MSCEHSDQDCYLLTAFGVSTRFCRFDDCHEWLVDLGDTALRGTGLESFQDTIAGLALDRPEWAGAALLYDLLGHAPELGSSA